MIKWPVKYHAREFLLNDASWTTRSVEVDGNKIITGKLYYIYMGDNKHTQNNQIKH